MIHSQKTAFITTSIIGIIIIIAVVSFNIFPVYHTFSILFSPIERNVQALLPIDQSFCQQTVNTLTAELAQLKLRERENEELRRLFDFQERSAFKQTAARVISYDPIVRTLLYIDRGSNESIQQDQPVIVGEGIIIGKISSIGPGRSIVTLLTNESSRLAVQSIDDHSVRGIVRSSLGTSLTMEFIVDEATLNVGDIIVTSGVEPLIPPGLVVGKVQNIVHNPDELFYSATVQPMIDYSSLGIVSVVSVL